MRHVDPEWTRRRDPANDIRLNAPTPVAQVVRDDGLCLSGGSGLPREFSAEVRKARDVTPGLTERGTRARRRTAGEFVASSSSARRTAPMASGDPAYPDVAPAGPNEVLYSVERPADAATIFLGGTGTTGARSLEAGRVLDASVT